MAGESDAKSNFLTNWTFKSKARYPGDHLEIVMEIRTDVLGHAEDDPEYFRYLSDL